MVPDKPKNQKEAVRSKAEQKRRHKSYYDRNAKPLPPLPVGRAVRIRDDSRSMWRDKAIVLKKVTPRSYLVKSERGGVLRRNRRDLLATRERPDVLNDQETDQETSQETDQDPSQVRDNISEHDQESDLEPDQTEGHILEHTEDLSEVPHQPPKTKQQPQQSDVCLAKRKPVTVTPQPGRRSDRTFTKTKRLIEEI